MRPLSNRAAVAPAKTAAHKCGSPACISSSARTGGAAAHSTAQHSVAQATAPGRKAVAPSSHSAKGRITASSATSRSTPPARTQPAAGKAQADRAAPPSRASAQRQTGSQPSAIARPQQQSRKAPAASPMGSEYVVHRPVNVGGGNQQIRVTIKGTRQVAGSVDISPTKGGKVYISNLMVDKQHRRRGVATQLMNAALKSARNQGFSAARLEARPSDTTISSQSLVSMYQKMGFRNVGKSGRGNPLMERRL